VYWNLVFMDILRDKKVVDCLWYFSCAAGMKHYLKPIAG
jgi:hypothetical protein